MLAQWEDTGAVTLFLAGQRYTGHFSCKKDKFVSYPAKNQDWQYSYRYDDKGVLNISSKGKVVTSGTEIAIALYILRSACSIDKAIGSRFGDAPRTPESFYGRKYKHLYTDLGLSEEVLESGLIYTWRLEAERPKIRAAYSKPHETELKALGNVRPIHTINECKDIGNAMSICVGSYRQLVLEGRVDIAVLEDNGAYIACLEIKDGELVQAKLAYNRKVSTNPEVAEQVRAWCELNSLTINTLDM